jgi:hypothetical protein
VTAACFSGTDGCGPGFLQATTVLGAYFRDHLRAPSQTKYPMIFTQGTENPGHFQAEKATLKANPLARIAGRILVWRLQLPYSFAASAPTADAAACGLARRSKASSVAISTYGWIAISRMDPSNMTLALPFSGLPS